MNYKGVNVEAVIGAKIIYRGKMSLHTFLRQIRNQEPPQDGPDLPGYYVVYPADFGEEKPYESWSPAKVCENAYRPITPGEASFIIQNEAQDTMENIQDSINEGRADEPSTCPSGFYEQRKS